MSPKLILTVIVVVIAAVVVSLCWGGLVGKNEATHWQIKQSIGGNVTVQDAPGYYWKGFATITPYPRYVSMRWNDDASDGDKAIESIRTTFNDGGTAQISTDIRYATPITETDRKTFHQQFSGNIDNATIAVKSHLINCVKASGPLMSASENQSARKAEFTQLIENQTVEGLYGMERIEKNMPIPQSAEEIANGTPVRYEAVAATKLVLDDKGMPKIAKTSPLTIYGISILQFSVTETVYDPETLKQFVAKKASFLAAEQSKADKIKFAQAEMSTVAEYDQLIAEAKGKADMEKMKQVTDAERDKELAEIEAQKRVTVETFAKEEALVKANKALEVAEIEKAEALTVAGKELEVATIGAKAAEQDKLATISEAEGKEKAIQLSGAITETEEVLAKIAAERDVQIAMSLKDMKTPGMIIMGGGEGNGGMQMPLLNVAVMKAAGVLPANFSVTNPMTTAPVVTK